MIFKKLGCLFAIIFPIVILFCVVNYGIPKTVETTKKAEINYLSVSQNIIQDIYKKSAESKGQGVPEVDCNLVDHWQNDQDGLVYVKGTFTLAGIDKIKHTYNARYGSETSDLVYLMIDNQKVFYDEAKQTKYMDNVKK